jgi:hypothetical protein
VTVDEQPATTNEQPAAAATAAELPREGDLFYLAGAGYDVMLGGPAADEQPVLERLGQPTFRTSSFPLMGLLESVYEHVAQHVGSVAPPPPPDGAE